MRKNDTFLALLLAAAGGMVLPSLAARPEAHAYQVTAVTGSVAIELGTPERTVFERVGRPDKAVGDKARAYYGFGVNDRADPHGCRILLLTFQNAKVSDIKLINPRALRALTHRCARGESNLETAFVREADSGYSEACAPAGSE